MLGRLIVIEGIDGAGKSTQARLLLKNLKSSRVKTILLKEPTNKIFKKLIKETDDEFERLLLFLLDRYKNFQKIKEYLKKGFFVILDRSFPSTLVYQYYCSKLRFLLKEELIIYLNHLAMNHISPDLVIILDIEHNTALERIKSKKSGFDLDSYNKKNFLKKAREGYLYFAKKLRWKVINGDKEKEEIALEILKEVSKII